MRVPKSVRDTIWHLRGRGQARWAFALALALVVALGLVRPLSAAAHGTADHLPHTLAVTVTYPDDGLTADDHLCLDLFAGDSVDGSPPVQSQCLDPGDDTVSFDGISHGPYTILVLAPGSTIDGDRYQGQIVGTDIPNDPERDAFAIPVTLRLSPEAAGTTGRVEISVFGCPPGTDGGGDATIWASKCDKLIGGAPVSLSGIGTVDDTSNQASTGVEGEDFGKVDFPNLPAGAYQVDDTLPNDISQTAAVFVSSSIDGGPPSPITDQTVAVSPAEIKSVNYYVVLQPGVAASPQAASPADSTTGNPDIGGPTSPSEPVTLPNPDVAGGLPPTAPPSPEATSAPTAASEPPAAPTATPAPTPAANATPAAFTATTVRSFVAQLPATGTGVPAGLAGVAGAALLAFTLALTLGGMALRRRRSLPPGR